MEPVEIQYRLKRLGVSQRALADALAVSPGVVSNTIWGRATSWTVASQIARLLDSEPAVLWPDRYCYKPRSLRKPISLQLFALTDKEKTE